MENIIGERIKELRIKNNMTQQDLALLVGLTSTGVSYWESGKANPDVKSINKLADYFNVSIDYIYGKTDLDSKLLEDKEMDILFRKATDLDENKKVKLKKIIGAGIDALWEEDEYKDESKS